MILPLCFIVIWAAQPSEERPAPPSRLEVEQFTDDLELTGSITAVPGVYLVPDTAADGAIRISGDDITIDFGNAVLRGAAPDTAPDDFSGIGVLLRGHNITLRNLKVHGYKIGIYARACPGLVVEDVDISDNFAQRLGSTVDYEDAADWLYPHHNDQGEWRDRYGAGLYVERSERVTLRRIRARRTQNGIVLDRVSHSWVYDCDCSFLSGWGLAMWRSDSNLISRNAFDFCVRGYSHGVYNRGQDSAGILMFEQNNQNVIVENSATHCGDGLFAFGGQASLAGSGRTGNNNNLIIGNDFSYAVAHGIELTFSFDNIIMNNRLVANAICGVWGGYSQDTLIAANTIESNGDRGYGLERGGVNIEHGRGNRIISNQFTANKCGIHLWSDEDKALLDTPWCRANHQGSVDNVVANNHFLRDELAIQLRHTTKTRLTGNVFDSVVQNVEVDDSSEILATAQQAAQPAVPHYDALGQSRPVGRRGQLSGRDHIIVTQWGPYDYHRLLVAPDQVFGNAAATIQVLGPAGEFEISRVDGSVKVSPRRAALPGVVKISPTTTGLCPFEVEIKIEDKRLQATGTLLSADWTVKFFEWSAENDPREHPQAFGGLIGGKPRAQRMVDGIDFNWGYGGPGDLVPADHFATVATTRLRLPAGRYAMQTISDDGIRVWVNEQLVIDDWTWHAPKANDAQFDLEDGEHDFRVEHFEIDGYAQLRVRFLLAH